MFGGHHRGRHGGHHGRGHHPGHHGRGGPHIEIHGGGMFGPSIVIEDHHHGRGRGFHHRGHHRGHFGGHHGGHVVIEEHFITPPPVYQPPV